MKNKKYKSTGGMYESGYQRSCIPTTTNVSKNDFFEKNGYLFLPKLIDNPKDYFDSPPIHLTGKRITGQIKYIRKDRINFVPNEEQVPGSLSRYNMPNYKELHYLIRKKIEKQLEMDLLPTYYYDRFYYAGQRLNRHSDRFACEISVTLQISSNGKEPWPIWFERPDQSESYVLMENGDAVVYKGCEREHWRDPLQSKYNKLQNVWRKIKNLDDDTYHHQIFFHYVNAQGPFVHYANDPSW